MNMTVEKLKEKLAKGVFCRNHPEQKPIWDLLTKDQQRFYLSTADGLIKTIIEWCDENNIYQVPNADKHPTTPGWYHLRLVSDVLK